MSAPHLPRIAYLTLASFVALTANAASVRAGAEPAAWFLFRIDPCVRVNSEAIAQQVSTELGRLRGRPRATAGPVMLRISCQGEQNLLVARMPGSGAELVRTIDVHLQPDELRERFLALAAAELLAASAGEGEQEGARFGAPAGGASDVPSTEIQPPIRPSPASSGSATAAPAPSPPPPPSAPPAAAPAPPRPAFPALRIIALAAYQVFLRESRSLWGGGAGVGWDGPHHIGLSFDVLARHGAATLDLGTVSIDTVSLGATAQLFFGWTRLRLRAGGGLRGGLVRLHGQPADPARTEGDSFSGGWLGPALALGITGRISRRISIELTTEGGYVVLPVTGQAAGASAYAVSIAGPFLGLQLGLGVFP